MHTAAVAAVISQAPRLRPAAAAADLEAIYDAAAAAYDALIGVLNQPRVGYDSYAGDWLDEETGRLESIMKQAVDALRQTPHPERPNERLRVLFDWEGRCGAEVGCYAALLGTELALGHAAQRVV